MDCETCGTPWSDIYGENAEFVAEFHKCDRCGWQTCELCRDSGMHDSVCAERMS